MGDDGKIADVFKRVGCHGAGIAGPRREGNPSTAHRLS
jgi:hypothetical protein